jgi:hypothetical protein
MMTTSPARYADKYRRRAADAFSMAEESLEADFRRVMAALATRYDALAKSIESSSNPPPMPI